MNTKAEPENITYVNTTSLANRCEYLERVNSNLINTLKLQDDHIKELSEDARLLRDTTELEDNNRVWIWQSDGYDNSASMANDLPVLIRAYQLRALLKHGELILEV